MLCTNIPTPCVWCASTPTFGRGMRTPARALCKSKAFTSSFLHAPRSITAPMGRQKQRTTPKWGGPLLLVTRRRIELLLPP